MWSRARHRTDVLALAGVCLVLVAASVAGAQPAESQSGEPDPFSREVPAEGETGFGTAHLFFEPAKLDWTAVPGAFELDLKRRNANPLYPKPRQIVTEEDLRTARIRDAQDAWAMLETFIDLHADAKRFAQLDTKREVDRVIDRLEAAIRHGMEIGGHGVRMAQGLRTLRGSLLEGWRNGGDARVVEEVKALERSGALDPVVTRDPFVAQLLREEGPIREDEQAPAILSEPPTSIALAMSALPAARKRQVQVDAGVLVQNMATLGVTLEDADGKLDALFEGDADLRRRVLQTTRSSNSRR